MATKNPKLSKANPVPTLAEMEWAVARMYDIRVNLIVPNVHQGFYLHECDLLICRPSGYLVEVEIKRSKSDLKADFNKPHRRPEREAKQLRIKELYYAVPEDLLTAAFELVPSNHGIISVRRSSGGWVSAEIVRRATPKPGARPVTEKEYSELARLGCLRVWGLKRIIQQNKLKSTNNGTD